MKTKVATVRDLRDALEGVPGDAPVLTQAVAGDGTTWTLFMDITTLDDLPHFKWNTRPAVVTLSHPDLATLPGLASAPPETRRER